MTIDGKTMLCGLIGNPVEHTLSPAIHNTLSELLGINLVYVPFLVAHGELADAVRGAHALNVKGMNVTVPYKSDVIACLDGIDDLAACIGAVNTLVRTEHGYKGYNTDMLGLYRALCEEGVDITGKKVVILGAGGAARAVAYLCVQKEAAEVIVLNRTLEKAEALAGEVNQSFEKEPVKAFELSRYAECLDKNDKYVVIQATSVGLSPKDEEVVIADAAFYEYVECGFDLIYKPAKTKFMKLCEAAGKPAYNGLKMLLYQGIIAYELWNDLTVDSEIAEKVAQVLESRA